VTEKTNRSSTSSINLSQKSYSIPKSPSIVLPSTRQKSSRMSSRKSSMTSLSTSPSCVQTSFDQFNLANDQLAMMKIEDTLAKNQQQFHLDSFDTIRTVGTGNERRI